MDKHTRQASPSFSALEFIAGTLEESAAGHVRVHFMAQKETKARYSHHQVFSNKAFGSLYRGKVTIPKKDRLQALTPLLMSNKEEDAASLQKSSQEPRALREVSKSYTAPDFLEYVDGPGAVQRLSRSWFQC